MTAWQASHLGRYFSKAVVQAFWWAKRLHGFGSANVWVTNQSSNTVTELRASDGTPLGTFAAGPGPVGVAFDSFNIWVADSFGSTVTKLRALDGSVLGTLPEAQCHGLAFDGANIWVTNTDNSVVSKL